MRIIVLGAAAGGGYPQWNSACAVGRRAWARDPNGPWRTQASLAVSGDGDRWTLLNASPDLRSQILATAALQPKHAPRHSPITSVVLTNGDVDHIAGLLTLRESHRFRLFASRRILAVLAANPIFDVLDPACVERCPLELNQPVTLAGGLTLTAFPVPGKVALYLEQAEVAIGGETEDTIGLEVGDGRKSFFYVPGCAAMSADLAARLRQAGLVFFDGTLWTDDEMIRAEVGSKTGARMGHMSVFGPEGSLVALGALDIDRKVLIHINNTNPILLEDSPERREVEAAGFEVAFDGMEIVL